MKNLRKIYQKYTILTSIEIPSELYFLNQNVKTASNLSYKLDR